MIRTVGLIVVWGAWVVMFVILRVRHVQLRRPTATRRPDSRIGLVLQLIAYVLVFGVRLGSHSAFEGGWGMEPRVAAPLAGSLCIAGAAIVIWSQHVLDVQWSLTARLVERHRLITQGPYAVVRHPIYAAMILMLLGTSVAVTSPVVFAVAMALYLPGTVVRVRSEEMLMQEAFGPAWAQYRRRVKALIPGVL